MLLPCRVEPSSSSHVFLVWGEACFRDERHPNCTHTEPGVPPAGKLFALDVEKLLGNEWKVGTCPPSAMCSRAGTCICAVGMSAMHAAATPRLADLQ